MPIYEYLCTSCGFIVEQLLTASETRVNFEPPCPHCSSLGDFKGRPMRRIMSLPASPVIGGVEGKLRTAEKIRQRNEAHHKSSKGRTEHYDNVMAAKKRGLPA